MWMSCNKTMSQNVAKFQHWRDRNRLDCQENRLHYIAGPATMGKNFLQLLMLQKDWVKLLMNNVWRKIPKRRNFNVITFTS